MVLSHPRPAVPWATVSSRAFRWRPLQWVNPMPSFFFPDHLRQDWRITSNRSRIDNSAAFAYFGDNLLGMWVITYFWYTKFAVGGRGVTPTPTCRNILAAAGRQNGLSLDGTPIVRSGEELLWREWRHASPGTLYVSSASPAVLCHRRTSAPGK
jgi:hypothetical protein